MQRPRVSQIGFTLVELLIVIVVIAILAAISIVAYNGIQERAMHARIDAAIDSYSKAFELYYVTNDNYPDTGSGCLGGPNDYPSEGDFAANECIVASSGASTSLSPALNQALFASSSPPNASLPPVSVSYGPSLQYQYRGVWVSSQESGYEFQYWLRGNKQCTKGSTTYNAAANATRCIIYWGGFSS